MIYVLYLFAFIGFVAVLRKLFLKPKRTSLIPTVELITPALSVNKEKQTYLTWAEPDEYNNDWRYSFDLNTWIFECLRVYGDIRDTYIYEVRRIGEMQWQVRSSGSDYNSDSTKSTGRKDIFYVAKEKAYRELKEEEAAYEALRAAYDGSPVPGRYSDEHDSKLDEAIAKAGLHERFEELAKLKLEELRIWGELQHRDMIKLEKFYKENA